MVGLGVPRPPPLKQQINSTRRDVANVASIRLVLNITLEGAELINMGNDVLGGVKLNNLVTDD